MSTLSNSNARNDFDMRGVVAFMLVAVFCIAALIMIATTDELFVASEYEGVTTELRYDFSRTSSKEIIPQGTPVKMTGRLYGVRGNVAYLEAEVVTPMGEVEWVPLVALEGIVI